MASSSRRERERAPTRGFGHPLSVFLLTSSV